MSVHELRVVTPEAVELELDSAGLASRFLAAWLDMMILFTVLYAVLTVASIGVAAGATGGAAGDGVFAVVMLLILTFALLVLWPTIWEVATKGRSIGKLALGLRVVTIEGAPIGVRHAVIRGALGLFEILLTAGVVAVGVALGSRRFRRMGDHLAGTIVVRERGAVGVGAAPHRFVPYPGWEAWTARLDATRLTPDDYRLVRTYLLRSRQLPVEARHTLGRQLLARVLPLTGHDEAIIATLGPWPVEAPLVAVAAAYQRRFDNASVS